MQLKKISIENSTYLTFMWIFLMLGHASVLFFSYAMVRDMILDRQPYRFEDYVFLAVIFLIYAVVFTIWKMATFRRRNFIKLAENIGIKFTRKFYYNSLIEVIGVYTFACGYWDNIYVFAKMDVPFFAYAPFHRISLTKLIDEKKVVVIGGEGPDYMKEESRIELFSLIKGPYGIDAAIRLENGKGEIPMTGCPELDGAIKTQLTGTQYFNARLIFNKDCLRMIIIGGSWEGRRFGEKIQKGFEMFKQMNDALKIKYPVASWDKYQVKWNRSEETFYLAGQ